MKLRDGADEADELELWERLNETRLKMVLMKRTRVRRTLTGHRDGVSPPGPSSLRPARQSLCERESERGRRKGRGRDNGERTTVETQRVCIRGGGVSG